VMMVMNRKIKFLAQLKKHGVGTKHGFCALFLTQPIAPEIM